MTSRLKLDIEEYYKMRALKHPNVWEALGWATAELGEVYEVLMSQSGGWVRNNPQNHPKKTDDDLAEELGDVIFMLVVAGIEKGVDPIDAMERKMRRKLQEDDLKREAEEYGKWAAAIGTGRIATGVSSVVPLTDKEAERIFKETGDREEELRED